jgi:hypothetical protein
MYVSLFVSAEKPSIDTFRARKKIARMICRENKVYCPAVARVLDTGAQETYCTSEYGEPGLSVCGYTPFVCIERIQ